jgi:hypothetical protein
MSEPPDTVRENGHWQREDYKQRMTAKQWKKILLNYDDTVIMHGRLRQLQANSLGAGVVEISKVPLEQTP